VGDLLGDACVGPAEETAPGGGGKTGRRCCKPGEPSPESSRDAGESASRRIAEVWPGVVGEEVAANARPAYLRRGRLVVSTSSTVWAQTLQFMGEMLVGRLNEHLGENAVNEVVFRHAGWEDRPARGAVATVVVPESHSLSAEERAALDDVVRMGLPPRIRDQILQAMAAAFARSR